MIGFFHGLYLFNYFYKFPIKITETAYKEKKIQIAVDKQFPNYFTPNHKNVLNGETLIQVTLSYYFLHFISLAYFFFLLCPSHILKSDKMFKKN